MQLESRMVVDSREVVGGKGDGQVHNEVVYEKVI